MSPRLAVIPIRDGQGRAAYKGMRAIETRGRPPPFPSRTTWSSGTNTWSPRAPTSRHGREDDWVLDGAYIDRAL